MLILHRIDIVIDANLSAIFPSAFSRSHRLKGQMDDGNVIAAVVIMR